MRRAVVVVLLAIASAACHGETVHRTSASSSVRAPGREVTVSWTPVPDPIPLNALFALELAVTPSDEGTEVEVDAGMPGHGHGMTVRPRTARRPDGSYEAKGLLFHMPGEWEIVVTVTRAGASETLRFPVTVP